MPNPIVVLQINNIVESSKVILKQAQSVAVPQAWNLLQLAVADIIQQILSLIHI